MKKNKLIKNFAFFLVMTIFLLSFSSATLTLVSPASSSTISGTATLNASSTVLTNMLNCTWYARSTSTANSTYSSVGTQTNETNETTVINTTFDSTILEDSNDYSFYAICFNTSNNETSATTTGITVDNTVPQTPSSLSPSDGETKDDTSVSFSATVTGSNTTGCTLTFVGKNPGSTTYTMTLSGNTCTHTLTIPEETYDYYIIASDGTNTSNSATTRFNIDVETSSNFLFQQTGTQTFAETISSDGNKSFFWIIILIITIFAIVYIVKK